MNNANSMLVIGTLSGSEDFYITKLIFSVHTALSLIY